jgi:Short C-terminal domain
MRQLTPAGEQAVNEIAQRHGFGFDAVATMLDAVVNGNGGMAQFSHPEFGGSGQWMRGGMTMIGDMFNNNLKGRVDGLCSELSSLIANQPGLIQTGSFQSQTQGNQQPSGFFGGLPQTDSSIGSPVSLFVPAQEGGRSGNWWPEELGGPNSAGAQNNARYAYFAQSRRLAIELNGTVTVYDTLDHQIGGFSQQQSYGGSLTFSSQHGVVDVASLPVVSVNGVPPPAADLTPPVYTPPPGDVPSFSSAPEMTTAAPTASGMEADIIGTIEKLADLHSKGILSNEEFTTKKAELLARL